MNKELLNEYADLKIQKKRIDAKLDFINEEALREVRAFIAEHDGVAPAIEGKGSYSIKTLKKWQYTADYEQAKQALQEIKENEEATGLATFTENESLIFTEQK